MCDKNTVSTQKPQSAREGRPPRGKRSYSNYYTNPYLRWPVGWIEWLAFVFVLMVIVAFVWINVLLYRAWSFLW